MHFYKLTPPVIIGAKDFLTKVDVTCDKREKCKKLRQNMIQMGKMSIFIVLKLDIDRKNLYKKLDT